MIDKNNKAKLVKYLSLYPDRKSLYDYCYNLIDNYKIAGMNESAKRVQTELDNRIAFNTLIEGTLPYLNEREYRVIDLRFFCGKTMEEIAEEENISLSSAYRILENALTTFEEFM